MKINLVYHTPKILSSGYMGSLGLKNALEKNGYLANAYDDTTLRADEESLKTLGDYPIYFVRGFLAKRTPIVERAKNQFKAVWQSESYYTRHGELDGSTAELLDNLHNFNMLFVCSESDLDSYEIPTYFLPSWADTTVLDDYEPPILDGLGFIGNPKGREDFLNQDTFDIIRSERTREEDSAKERALDYGKAICKYSMLVSPPGRAFNGMCGRAWEIMACNRLCFQYYNQDTMFLSAKYFRDGIDIVYFKDYDDLYEKYKYYKARPGLSAWVAYNGYIKTRKFHNQDIRARYIVNCMYEEHKRWKSDTGVT